jgi:HK97 family phage major capsid protein/HK97 family phage prohead protease
MDRLEFKGAFEVDDAGAITGLAAIYGTPDLGGDIIHKGAFAGAACPLPMFVEHNPEANVGVWESLAEVEGGLQVKGRLLVKDIAKAAEARALIRSGSIGGLSIGYIATKASPRHGGGRNLHRLDLKEISVVSVPMHPDAKITESKARGAESDDMTEEQIRALLAEQATAAQAAQEQAVALAVKAAVAPYVQRLDVIEAKGNRPAGNGDDRKDPTIEQKAFHSYLTRGPLAPETETKALSASSDPNGGYLVTPEFSAEVLKDIIDQSPIRSIASVKGTGAPSVIYPTRGPMGNATWDDDTTAAPETSVTNIFGQLEVVTKAQSTFIDIPNSLLQDAPAVEAEVREGVTEDFGRKEAVSFVKGSGVYEPEGVMTNAKIPVFNYGASTFAATDPAAPFITMLYSIAPSYRNKGVWAMNGTTIGKIRNWTDANGLKLWQPSLQIGQPETFLGRPLVEVPDMDDVAANAFPVLYGDFSGYRILDRIALSMLVDPYSQATLKRTRYHFGRRVGGQVIQPIKFKKMKMA